VAVIDAIRAAGPGDFEWRDPPYEYEHDKAPIDILYGSAELRERLDRGEGAAAICAGWTDEVKPFLNLRQRYLVY
jgi:uncharacterized protein YbbC (DUF1343 family)